MKHKFLSVVLSSLLLISIPFTAYAGGSSYHNNVLSRMLFSSGHCQSSEQSQSALYTEMLQNAVYLTIDQSGNKTGDQDKLNHLRDNGVKKIAADISTLNPEVAFLHRSYTHRGWDWVYIDDKSNWEARKTILLNTAETIFNFDKHYNSTDANKKRNAFCKILYYQHILGDLIYDDKDTLKTNTSSNNSEFQEKERGLIIAFAYEHPGSSNRDIFWELSDAIETLFADQKNSHKYSGLIPKLNSLAKESRALSALHGKIDAREFTKQRLAYEEQLLELLESYLPLLLDDEKFFKHAFPA